MATGDLLVELGVGPMFRPIGIYRVRGVVGRTVSCNVEFQFPASDEARLKELAPRLRRIADSPPNVEATHLMIRDLLATLVDLFADDRDTLRKIHALLESAPSAESSADDTPPPSGERQRDPQKAASRPRRQARKRLWIYTSEDARSTVGAFIVQSTSSVLRTRVPFAQGDLVVQIAGVSEGSFVAIYEVADKRPVLGSTAIAAGCKLRFAFDPTTNNVLLPSQLSAVTKLTLDDARPIEEISFSRDFREDFVRALLHASAGKKLDPDILAVLTMTTATDTVVELEALQPQAAQQPQPQVEHRPQRQAEQQPQQQVEPRTSTAPARPSAAPADAATNEPAASNNETPTTSVTVNVNAGGAPAPANDGDAFWIEIKEGRLETWWKGVPTSSGSVTDLSKLAFVADPGPALYAAVLESKALSDEAGVPTSFEAAFAKARDRARRVLLNVPKELQLLPWEAMAGEHARFGIDEDLPLARWVRGIDRDPARQPLRIIFAVANPRGLGQPENGLLGRLSPIDRDAEIGRCKAAVQPLVDGGAKLEIVPATRAGLIAAMVRGPHIFHLVAHGVWNNAKGDYGVVLEKSDGTHDICFLGNRGDTNTMLSILDAGNELRLVVLGCCYSGAFAKIEDAVKVSLGARLAEVVPTVVAMQDMITPEAVGYFATGFYAGLARTGETDRAAAIGRLMMRHLLPAVDRQWTLPAVFVGTTRPTVFDPDSASQAAGQAARDAMTRIASQRVRQDDPIAVAARGAGASMPAADAIAAATRAALMQQGATLVAGRPPDARPEAIRQLRDELARSIAGPVALVPGPALARVGPAGSDLVLPESVAHQTIAALNSGKHVIFIGPPGTGKTTLTLCLTELAERARFTTGTISATASADWSTAETVGALLPARDGVAFRPGLVLDAILEGKWLVIDEINRAEIDKAFGELFTILSGQPITIPFGRDARRARVMPAHRNWRNRLPVGDAAWNAAAWTPDDATADDIVVHPNFRILASMNVYDRSFLFSMSLAFMRRFAFIDVDLPDNYGDLITQWLTPGHRRNLLVVDEEQVANIKATLLALIARDAPDACKTLQSRRALGPAILADVLRHVAQRRTIAGDWQNALGEAVALYVVPQLDGLAPEVVEAIEKELAKILPVPVHRTGASLVCARLRALYPHVFG